MLTQLLSLDEILFDEEPHTYTFRGERYDSVTQVIRLSGLGDDFSAVPQDRMEYAQRRGRMVHLACQYYDEGDLDLNTVDSSILGYVEAYIAFRQERKLKVIAVEQKIISPFDCAICGHKPLDHVMHAKCRVTKCACPQYVEGLGMAGTPDLICFMGAERCVIDRKTSQYMSRSMGLQTAGYKIGWNRGHPNEPVGTRYGLRLEKTGKYKLFPHENPVDELAFMDALAHVRSLRRMERWVLEYAA